MNSGAPARVAFLAALATHEKQSSIESKGKSKAVGKVKDKVNALAMIVRSECLLCFDHGVE